MQIEIDFEVFKALTALRVAEEDSYNNVLRKLLNMEPRDSDQKDIGTIDDIVNGANRHPVNVFQLLKNVSPSMATEKHGNFLSSLLDGGAWFSNVYFPNGTLFRATYKGKTYGGEISEGNWIDQGGVKRTSPSDAANAICGTSVNGWRFWYAKRPTDEAWVKLEELKA